MNRKAKQEMHRRQALQILGAATVAPLFRNPISMVIESLVKGLINEARAEVAGKPLPRNLIVFYMTGGAARWAFDQSHDPYKASSGNGGNKQVITGFRNGNADLIKNQFNFSQGRTLYLPPVWGSSIAPSSGKSVQMSELLRNAIVMQGVNMLADGHRTNAAALVMPNPNGMSYGGMIADASPAELAAIALPNSQVAHRAPSGSGIAQVNNFANPLSQLLSPFQRKPASGDYLSRRDAMDLAMKSALQKLGTFASSTDPAAIALFSAQSKAEKLLKRSFGDLNASYATLVKKYMAIQRTAIDQSRTGVVGVTDQMIANGSFSAQERLNGAGNVADIADLRDLISPIMIVQDLAENFAIAEYMILNGFSQYVSAFVGNVFYAQIASGRLETINSDEHDVGAAVSLVVNTARYRAFCACLLELTDMLKQKGLWNDSVILWGSEFNRDPRMDGSGSDHGWRGNVYTLLSGAIDGPYYVGNTSTIAGSSAPTKIGSSEVDSVVRGYVASTVSTLARIQSPASNNSSFLTLTQGGTYVLNNIELSKGVAS
jgi:hypothetical protein